MALILGTILFAVFVWWGTTGIIVYAVRAFDARHSTIMIAACLLAALGTAGLVVTANMVSAMGAYLGFASALLIWAFFEMAFLLGWLTGPRKIACPDNCSGFERFKHATNTVIHHELALVTSLCLMIYFLVGSGNLIGLVTFAVLWVMRLSTKLILFLGAPHSLSEMMPQQISYMQTYFRTDRTTFLFPIFIAGALALLTTVLVSSINHSSEFATVSHTLIASFLVLAIIEHFFLIMPVRDSALWSWALAKNVNKTAHLANKNN